MSNILGRTLAIEWQYLELPWHEQHLRGRINGWPEFHIWHGFNHEFDWFLTLHSGRIHVDIAGKPHFRDQRNRTSGHAAAIRLLNTGLQMRGFRE